ncbi:MFS transporter [Microbulbifer rhizosphaerae]|uniref:MFS family permease n=1 Tax=Microbulbifer rhizosphaerae TaxID=1562603 RepID=A0A7W4WCW9_9GAMM|nr:MFS transporter [Microbulbifer rhizosphaerae]MBB3061936.1 MFS family permease [Microbulbifer rhizosphaerae]
MRQNIDAPTPGAGSRRRWATAAVLLSLFLAAMDSTIVGTLLPVISGEFTRPALYPWVMSAFIYCSVVAAAMGGTLADRLGEKRLLLAALLLFLAGMVAAALAADMPQLIAARAAQGAGAGLIMVLSYTLVGRLFGPGARGRMQGLLSGIWGLAAIAGPLLGGLVHELLGWRWVFFLNVPLILVAAVLIAATCPAGDKRGTSVSSPLHLPALASFCLLVAVLLTAIMLPAMGVKGGLPWLLAALPLLGAVYWHNVAAKPAADVLPRAFFTEPHLRAAALLTALAAVALYGSVTLLPLYLAAVSRGATLTSGSLVLAAALGWVLGSALCGALLVRTGYRTAALCGAVLLAAGAAVLAFAPPTVSLWQLVLAQVAIGLGIGCAATTTLVLVQNSAAAEHLGRYTSAVQLFRNLGAAIGINTLAAIHLVQAGHGGDAAGAFQNSFSVLFALTVVALLCATGLPGRARVRAAMEAA